MAIRDAIKSSLKQLNGGCVPRDVSRLMIMMITIKIMMLAVAVKVMLIWLQPNSQFCFSSIDKALKSNYDDKSVNIRQSF